MDNRRKEDPVIYCKYCGKKLERRRFPSGRLEDLSAFSRRKYCDRMCMRKDYLKTESGNQTYGNAHTTARKANELIIKKQECEICGKTGKLDVHHIDDNYQNNDLKNLMILCRSCHMKQHMKNDKCKICGDPVKGLGYCNKHYIRYKKYGDATYVSPNSRIDSNGELAIIKLLKDNNIPFIHNKMIFKDCVLSTGGIARFDFYVNNSYVIEYDSQMHYKYTKSGWYTEEEYNKTKQRDSEKNEYCWSHNIPIIRIPYWIYDTLSIDDLKLETSNYITQYKINGGNS